MRGGGDRVALRVRIPGPSCGLVRVYPIATLHTTRGRERRFARVWARVPAARRDRPARGPPRKKPSRMTLWPARRVVVVSTCYGPTDPPPPPHDVSRYDRYRPRRVVRKDGAGRELTSGQDCAAGLRPLYVAATLQALFCCGVPIREAVPEGDRITAASICILGGEVRMASRRSVPGKITVGDTRLIGGGPRGGGLILAKLRRLAAIGSSIVGAGLSTNVGSLTLSPHVPCSCSSRFAITGTGSTRIS